MPPDHQTLLESLDAGKEQIALLLFSGAGGAFFRAVLTPEQHWKRRIVQGMAGGLSALFLGGVVGHVIDAITGAGVMSYAASGFLMGSGGEAAVKSIQDRFMVQK